jgi:hypothetical protein
MDDEEVEELDGNFFFFERALELENSPASGFADETASEGHTLAKSQRSEAPSHARRISIDRNAVLVSEQLL